MTAASLCSKRFALGAIGDDDVGFRAELHVRGESASARADDSG